MNKLALVLSLLAVFIAAGVASLFVGAPLDVSDLKNSAGGKVRVAGEYVSSYVEGGRLYILLRGRDGFLITAVVPYSDVVKRYGPVFKFSGTVVLEGVYYPANKTLAVSSILQGCHSAYYNPAG